MILIRKSYDQCAWYACNHHAIIDNIKVINNNLAMSK